MAFGQKAPQPQKGTLEYYEKNYNICRANLLAVILFTVVSVIMILTSDRYFLFSNYFAVEMATLGFMYINGDWKNWEDAADWAEMGQDVISVIGAISIAIAAVILIVLAICWALSKKSRIPMIVAAVIMGFDTLYLLLYLDIINIVFHVWIMYYLITAIKAWGDMKRLEEQMASGFAFEGAEQTEDGFIVESEERNGDATVEAYAENADGQGVDAVENTKSGDGSDNNV